MNGHNYEYISNINCQTVIYGIGSHFVSLFLQQPLTLDPRRTRRIPPLHDGGGA
jgi:hypothetical protein